MAVEDPISRWVTMVREDLERIDPVPGSHEYALCSHLFTALDRLDAALAESAALRDALEEARRFIAAGPHDFELAATVEELLAALDAALSPAPTASPPEP